jgi:RimJ/RimL family protein N-acetyltransferase
MTCDLLPIVQTERLRLRAFEPGDASDLCCNMTPSVTRWLASWPDPVTQDYALARIARARAGMERGVSLFYALERIEDGRVIGGLGGGLIPEDPARLEVSYHLAEDCHGAGYMGEAVRAALPVIWRLMPVQAIEAGAQLANAASFAVMRAMGMTPVGERMVYSSARGREEPTGFYEIRRPVGL